MTPADALAAAVCAAALPPEGRLLAVLGDPVSHSLSPALHGAALAGLGLPHRYVAVRCGSAGLGALLERTRRLPVLGLNLTAPLKEAALPYLDELTPLARAVGAVNTIARAGDRLVGHNTDVRGFVSALREDAAFDPAGRIALVVGAGGAARAVCAGLLDAGAARVLVHARRPEQARALAADLAAVGQAAGGSVAPATAPFPSIDLVVQCTPLGLDAAPGSSAWREAEEAFATLPWGAWAGRVVAADLNYRPARTAFVACAEAAGCRATNGLGMLLHQAAEAFSLWTGLDAPLGVMRAALGGETASTRG